MAQTAATERPPGYRFNVEQFHDLLRRGYFEDQWVELVAGEIVVSPPPGPEHAFSATRLNRYFMRTFDEPWVVRIEQALTLGDSEVTPDLAVVEGPLERYGHRHPLSARLVVEVSHSSLTFDRGEKARLYATAGVEEYWIVNVAKRQVEVLREPSREGYRRVEIFSPGQEVASLASPDRPVSVADLFPEPTVTPSSLD